VVGQPTELPNWAMVQTADHDATCTQELDAGYPANGSTDAGGIARTRSWAAVVVVLLILAPCKRPHAISYCFCLSPKLNPVGGSSRLHITWPLG